MSVDGKIITQKWIDGLHAPKGMVISNGKLFVADINDIVEIDVKSLIVLQRYTAEGATFLNDVTIDKKGNIYVSNTFGFSAIYKLNTNKKVETFLKDEALQMPNGLIVENDRLVVAPWGIGFDTNTYQTKTGGSLLTISLIDRKIRKISTPIGNLDGIEKTSNGYLLTDWLAGRLLYFKDNITTELVDLPQGSADLEFDEKNQTIYVPLMNDDKIIIYNLKE